MIPALTPSSTVQPPAAAPERLDEAADAFEAVFLRQMLASMRSASFGESLFDSAATEQYRTMLDSTLADSMAAGNRLGIAEALTARLGPLVGRL
jgi:peptidoglycan hydrolase FlgJ